MVDDEVEYNATGYGTKVVGNQYSQNGFKPRNTNGLYSSKKPFVILVLLLVGIILPLLRIVNYIDEPGRSFRALIVGIVIRTALA